MSIEITVEAARKWIVTWSLAMVGAQLIFLGLAPYVGFPLDYPDNIHLIDIILPVFLGYVGSGIYFLITDRDPAATTTRQPQLLGLFTKGPIVIYTALILLSLIVFGYSNRTVAATGTGMSKEALETIITLALGILAASTSFVVLFLFS